LQRIVLLALNLFRWVASLVQSLMRRATGKVLVLDTGRRVRLGHQIAEGGFSFVFEAYDVDDAGGRQKYVLKRIRCPEQELLRACKREVGVHRGVHHPNLMPLLGTAVVESDCYMLFPYLKHSLRSEINRRTGLGGEYGINLDSRNTRLPPWNETTALQVFLGICRGVLALHRHNYSHRDVKVENVLFDSVRRPVLMDFGSVGPVTQTVSTRQELLMLAEEAATHTTMSYRPPELFEGGIRIPSSGTSVVVDFGKVDVWSLGCTLFAILFGASPSESEFSRRGSSHGEGRLRIVDCSQLKVLGGMPKPPPHSAVAEWYSQETLGLIEDTLKQDPAERLTLDAVLERVESLIAAQGGEVEKDSVGPGTKAYATGDEEEDDDDGIALISTNRLI